MEPTDNPEHPPQVPPQGAVGGKPTEPDVIFTDTDDSESTDFHSDGVEKVNLDGIDSKWTSYFRYSSAYQDQVDAIETFIDLLGDNGYYLLEGACGTGKTLAATTAGIHAIRDRGYLTDQRDDSEEFFPQYSRLLAVTPVKQQMKQFIEEMAGVNKSLPSSIDPVDTVVMRGRGDMMAYAYTDASPFDRHSVTEKADEIREMARKAIQFGSDIPLDWPDGMTPPEFSVYDYDWSEPSERAERYKDRYRYDPHRATAVKEIVSNLVDGSKFDRLVVDGVETPYPDYVPHTNDLVDMAEMKATGRGQIPMDLQGKFDPFYVGFFASKGGLPFGFEEAGDNVFDRESLFESACKRGICPHEAMAHLAEDAEVILGNYTHLFDPQTRFLTEEKIGLLDEETIVVVDEAHQVERNVRDMLSAELDLYTLNRAINDIEIIRNYAKGDIGKTPTPDITGSTASGVQKLVNEALETAGNFGVEIDELVDAEQLLRFTKQKLGEYGAEKLREEYESDGWQKQLDKWGPDLLEKKLTEPGDPDDVDDLTSDALSRSFDRQDFHNVYKAMLGVKFAYDALESEGIHDRDIQGIEVGEFFRRWASESNVEYYRHVVLNDKEKESIPDSFPQWVSGWTPKLQLFNCVPRDELRAVFSNLGGGVLMSATIQPADVYKEAVGIDDIPYPTEDEDDEDEGGRLSVPSTPSQDADLDSSDSRPSNFEQYPLRFPTENRLSLTVDVDKYTYKNRGSPSQVIGRMKDTRRQYANVLKDVLNTKGNVMVAMPNYTEAKWAYELFSEIEVPKELHLDQSSSSQETTETLDDFFEGGDSAIFTSARGTITEGVDYDGNKLHCCVGVGIPLIPTNTPRTKAIKAAYDDRMDGSGFETALTIPAVRKVRQAFGRVIRGDDEAGVRILLDKRYASSDWDGVKEYLSEQEQSEFQLTQPDRLTDSMSVFWNEVDYTVGQPADDVQDETTEEGQTEASGSADTDSHGDSERTSSSQNTQSKTSSDDDVEYSKIYFGDESNLSGWVAIDREIAEQVICPLVRKHTVDDPETTDVDTIKLNFAKELPVSGWTDVEASAVYDKIEQIARNHKR